MKPQQSQTVPFFNRGIRARTDVAVLQPGEYYDLLNTLTVQDGAISTRAGSANLSPALSNPGGVFNNPQTIPTPSGNELERLHTIHTLRLSGDRTLNPWYFGYGSEIYRSYPNGSGEFPSATQVALDSANNTYLDGNERFACVDYGTGASSKPSVYFGTSKGNLRDDGTLAKLEQWGIPRPHSPAVCAPGISTPVQMYLPTSGLLRISVQVNTASIVAVNVIAGVGLYRFPYTVNTPDVHPIDGVAMKTAGGTIIIPQNVTQTAPGSTTGTFEAYLAAPLGGGSIAITNYVSAALVSSGGYISETVYFSATQIDLSLGGKADDGYETDDAIHFTIRAGSPGIMQDIRIRIGVGETSTPVDNQPIDYYEHVITPNPAQSLAEGSISPTNDSSIYDVGLDQSFYADQGVVGDYYNVNNQYTQSFRPSQLPPVPAGTPAIFDGAVPKRQWIKSGRAGKPGFNWLNVTSITIQGRLANGDTSTAFELRVGNLYVQGGSGPDTTVPGAVPYDYRYQFCNPQTGALGAPSIAMINENFVEAQRTSIIVQVGGYDGDLPGRAPITFGGEGSILLYRRGGIYTDGIYRLVKRASIDGSNSNNSVSIIDDVPDADILAAPELQEDNDAPVSSPLQVAIRGTIASFTTSGIGMIRFTANISSGDTAKLRVRSIIEIGNGSTFEQSVVAEIHSVSAGTIDISAYAQREHTVGEIIQVNAVAEQPCTLSVKAFDKLFLAGDENNPSTLYASKTGMPESFPAVDAVERTLGRVLVTAPSDPIIVLDEFNAEVICITRNDLFGVPIWNGRMEKPVRAPVGRGCVDRRCYCKGDNALYFLSFDGIYGWRGGAGEKLTNEVDWIFNNRTVNGIPPLNYDLLEYASMEYVQNQIHFTYLATNGLFYRLVYEVIYERWTVGIVNSSAGNTDAVTVLYREPGTANLLIGRYNTDITNTAFEIDQWFQSGTVGASDGFIRSSDPTGLSGTPINFRIATPAFTAGDPALQKLITQAIVELSNPWSPVTVDVYYNYSQVPSTDQFVIPAENGVGSVSGVTLTKSSGVIVFTPEMVGAQVITAAGATANIVAYVSATEVTLSNSVALAGQAFYVNRRRRVPLPFGQISGTAAGTECYAMAFVFSGSTKMPTTFFSMTFDVAPLAEVQRAKGYDWEDFGHPYDKAFEVVEIEFNCYGQTVALTMDTLTGVDGQTQTLGVNTFLIGGAGVTRGKTAIPIRTAAGARVIAKMLRFRPTVTTANFAIFGYNAQKIDYPADILPFTEPDDCGHPWDKYFTQLCLDVDTGGVPATVSIFLDDDVTAAQILTVTSTNTDRNRDLALTSGLLGKKVRLSIQVGTGGKFQLFAHNWIWTPANKGAVVHSFDWSDIGHPYDKRFYHLYFEYEVTATTTFRLEGISGVAGNQTESLITTFTATPGSRKIQQYQFPINSIYKMVRIIPATGGPNVSAKIYQPNYTFQGYPPDIVPYTEPEAGDSAFRKYFQQLILDVDTGGVEAMIQVEIDGSIVQTLNVTTTALDRNRTLALQGSLVGRMARIINTPGAGVAAKFQLFYHKFVTLPADKGPTLHTYDWSDCGHQYDKRFYWMTFEYQISTPMSVVLEGVRGIAGNQTEEIIQTFALSESGSARKQQQFAFPVNSIYKLVRLRPSSGTPATDALIYQPVFQKEDYPPDICAYTEPEDSGTPYRKYYQQIVLDVDTGGVQALVSLELDGTVVQSNIPVTTTALDRNRQLTLNPALVGRKARLLANPGSGGKFQLFRNEFIVLPADKGPVLASFDWDDLGHPYSKRLKEFTFDAEIEQPSVEMIMDVIDGNDGTTHMLDKQRFLLVGPGRILQTLPVLDQTYATMIRFRPATTNINFKHWRYIAEMEKLPPNNTPFTDYDDLGGECEKIVRSVVVNANTGGVTALVGLEVDGQVVHRFTMNTTDTDRTRVISFPSDIIGFRFRLLPQAGPNGKFQYYTHRFERILEPCKVAHWDSYEQSFGSNGFKLCKQVWLEYMSNCPLRLTFYCDDGKLLWVEDMPQHDKREVYRFKLPKESLDGRVYNKSKVYRFTIDAMPLEGGWFKFYRDSTRLEVMNTSADQRAAWQQSYAWQQMPIPV